MFSTMFSWIEEKKTPNDEDNGDEIHQRMSRFADVQAQMEAQLHQTETLYAADRARNLAVLERLGLQGHFTTPRPPSVERQRPGSTIKKQRVRPVSEVDPIFPDVGYNSRTSGTQIYERSPATDDEEEEDLYFGIDYDNCSSGSICSDDSSFDCYTPTELLENPLITSPLDQCEWDQPPLRPFPTPPPTPPPANLQPRKVSRIPVTQMKYSKAEKEVAGGYKLQTAKGQVEEIQKALGHLLQNVGVSLTRPQSNPLRKGLLAPVCPTPAPTPDPTPDPPQKVKNRGKTFKPAPPPKPAPPKKTDTPKEAFKPAPPPKPAPPKKTDTPKEAIKPPLPPKPAPPKKTDSPKEAFKPVPPKKTAQTNSTGTHFGTPNPTQRTAGGGKKTESTSQRKTIDYNDLEEHMPLRDPSESLSLCFKMMSDENWEKRTAGLKIVQALAQHHRDIVKPKIHELCYAVTEEVHNLRSSVATVALETMVYLYVYMQTDMDVQAEKTGRALLLKIAQASVNTFIQQQANIALEALVQNCSPGPVLTALLNTGLSHLCPAVRASTAQQLHQLADRLGTDYIMTAGKTFTNRFVVAVNKMAVDSSATVRPHGLAMLQELALEDGFMDLWMTIVPQKERVYLEKSLSKMRRAKKQEEEEEKLDREVREMLQMFYHSVVASVLFYAAVCWGGNIADKNIRRLDKLVKKAASVLGRRLDPLKVVVERRTRSKLPAITDNASHPLHLTLAEKRSGRSRRHISLRCRTERYRASFVPTATRLHNTSVEGRGLL